MVDVGLDRVTMVEKPGVLDHKSIEERMEK